MRFGKLARVLAMAVLLTACATNYQSTSITGGFSEKELEPGIWRVGFSGNGYTRPETVQTYWLYRCAELALANGFEGFEVVSNIRLVGLPPIGEPAAADGLLHRVKGGGGTVIFVPGSGRPMPEIEADVRLVKQPFVAMPPKLFDAAALKAILEPLVTGPKCEGNNVCPHVHHYLNPDAPPSPVPEDKAS